MQIKTNEFAVEHEHTCIAIEFVIISSSCQCF